MRLIFIFLVLFLQSCQEKKETFLLMKKDIVVSVFASGKIVGIDQYDVFSSTNGIISQCFVKEGQEVKKGEKLFLIQNEALQINEENARLNQEFNQESQQKWKEEEFLIGIENARNKKDQDSILWIRQKKLWDQGIGSKNEMELRLLNYKNANLLYLQNLKKFEEFKRQKSFNARQSTLNAQLVSQQQSDLFIYSQLDGMILDLYKQVGEWANPQSALATLGNAGQFKIELQVDEQDIEKIRIDQLIYLKMESYPDKQFKAKVSRIIPIVNERTKTLKVEAFFVEQPKQLFANLSVEANILIEEHKNIWVAPKKAIWNSTYLIGENQKKYKVEVGLSNFDWVEIKSNLNYQTKFIYPE